MLAAVWDIRDICGVRIVHEKGLWRGRQIFSIFLGEGDADALEEIGVAAKFSGVEPGT